MDLGSRIREERKRRRITLVSLAEASGLTKGFLSQVESGYSQPSLASLRRISAALDISLAGLLHPPTLPDRVDSVTRVVRKRVVSGSQPDRLTILDEAGLRLVQIALPATYALASSAVSVLESSVGRTVLLVQSGSARVEHGTESTTVAAGDLLLLGNAGEYHIESSDGQPVGLLLWLPDGAEEPQLLRKSAAPMGTMTGRIVHDAGGPFQLVAMRARRGTSRVR